MKAYLPLLSLVLLFSSCTTAYKSGQTPDDVYFSPERPTSDYVRVEKRDNRQYRNEDEDYYNEDRALRMKIYDRRYALLDDPYYSYNPYYRRYNTYLEYNSPWNYYTYWNYNYNPYCGNYMGGYYNNYYSRSYGNYYGNSYGGYYNVVTPKTVYSAPRTYNLHVFDNNNNNVPYTQKGSYNSGNNAQNRRTENYRNSGQNAGSFLREVFSGNSSSSSSSGTYQRSSSSPTSSSSSSSGNNNSSSSSSGNAPVRKF